MLAVLDGQGSLLWADRAASRLTGLPPESLAGDGWRDTVHPEDLPRVSGLWERGAAETSQLGMDFRLVTPAQTDHWVHAELIPIFGPDGHPFGRLAVMTDLLAERAVITEAPTRERLVDAAFQAAPIGIEVFGRDGTAAAVNAAQLRLLGVPEEDPVVGRFNPLTDPAAAGARPLFLRAYDGEEVEAELTIPLGDPALDHRGSTRHDITVRQMLVPIRDEAGAVESVVAFVWDVTAEREAAHAQLELEREITDARHLESLAMLAGGIAHDFNNLHAAILGHAALARREMAPGSPADDDLEQIEHATRRAGELAQQLLAYSGRGQVLVEQIDISALARDAAASTAALATRSHQLTLQLAGDLPAVRGDAAQLRQMIRSLLVNAVEAYPGETGGRITLTTGHAANGDGVFIEVADAGSGMDPGTRARLFEPFFSTKAVGRGLGMAAVDGVVRALRGHVVVTSAEGLGTSVRVLLPATAAREPAPVPEPTTSGGSAILVVEDEALLALLARRVLEKAGYAVVIAADGATAVARLEDRLVPVDLVLLDMTLPAGVSGADVFEATRRLRPGVPVIVSTGWSADDVDTRVSGYAAFLQKPYHPDDLTAAIDRVLGGGARRPPTS
jgi:signal transduction histidine kinase/ActR/RegA family two-component response regulator